MFGITVSEAAKICGGKLSCIPEYDAEINRIVIDSRSAQKGDLFVAYKGENTDGHKFINSAFENGALCALAEYSPKDVSGPVIVCKDVQEALEMIISAFRDMLSIPIVGVSGSVGKTTTKEMVYSVLSEKFNVFRTEGNLNNTIGVPLSISGINRNHEIAVIELGINHFGEMDRLGRMAKPDVMLYTNIGHAHLEFLGDLNGVFRAKTEVLAHMKPDAAVIVNGDDELLNGISCTQNIVRYGTNPGFDVYSENVHFDNLHRVCCDIVCDGERVSVISPAYGRHMLNAMLAGAAVGRCFGLELEEIRHGIENYETVGRRAALIDTGYIILIDDCYNSNPDSCKSSLISLSDLPCRKVAIIGDFLEQGDKTVVEHREIGAFAKQQGIDLLIGIGQFGEYTSDIHFSDKNEFIPLIKDYIKKGDAVLVKASLGAHLEDISEELKKLS